MQDGSRDSLLIVSTSYPEKGDGSEAAGAFVADLVSELSRHHPVRVVAPGAHAGEIRDEGRIRVHRFSSPGRPLSLLTPTNPLHWPAIIATLSSLRAQTLAAASDGRVLHTLALWALPSGWAAEALRRKQGVPYSVWVLGSDIWSLGRIPVVRSMLRRVIQGADHCYSDGLQLGDDAESISARKFSFLPSTRDLQGVRRSSWASAPPFRFIYLGRWHYNKGVDLLLDALELLGDDDWLRIEEIHIAGGGPMEPLVRARVGALRDAGRPVRLSGFLDRGQASGALLAADYLLLPSRIESIPVVFSDALKAGLPIIAMPVGDLPRLMHGGALGPLSTSVTAGAFADALRLALATAPVDYIVTLQSTAPTFDLPSVARKLSRELTGSSSQVDEGGGRGPVES